MPTPSERVIVVADAHLGQVPPATQAAFHAFLDDVPRPGDHLLINGDLFDFWFEYGTVIPRRHFDNVAKLREVRRRKSATVYERVFSRHGDGPARGMMVGNSLKSDIVPAIKAGSWGIFIPHALTWAAEHADPPRAAPRFRQLERISEIPGVLSEIDG